MSDKRSQEFLDELITKLELLEIEDIRNLKKTLEQTNKEIDRLIHLIKHQQHHHLYLFFIQGDKLVAGSVSLTTQQTVPVSVVETNADGSVFTFDPNNIQYSVQDPSIVSVSKNADGSAVVTPLAVGSTQVGVADISTGASDQGTVTVTQGQGGQKKLTMTFGTPTP